MNLIYETVQALLASLTPTRKEAVLVITSNLLKLKLAPDAMDAIVAAVVLEAAESQYIEQGGARPAQTGDSTVDILKPLLQRNVNKKKSEVN